jgi:hypothetical protein
MLENRIAIMTQFCRWVSLLKLVCILLHAHIPVELEFFVIYICKTVIEYHHAIDRVIHP